MRYLRRRTGLLSLSFSCIARHWEPAFTFWRVGGLDPVAALAAALLVIGAPKMTFWGRQAMLEVPAYAFLIWSAVFLLKYIDTGKRTLIYASSFLFVCSLYSKLSAVFFLAAVFATLTYRYGLRHFLRKDVALLIAVTILAILPLAVVQLRFGQHNFWNVVGTHDLTMPHGGVEDWIWYAKRMPSMLGWPALAAGTAFIVTRLVELRRHKLPSDLLLLFMWLTIGYLFFSSIHLKDERHGLLLLAPLAIFAVLFAYEKLPRRVGSILALLLAGSTFAYSVVYEKPNTIGGYREAAEYVTERAASGSNILFSGYRDGSFVFNVRAQGRKDVGVLRADKILLRIESRRSLGVEQTDYSEDEIASLVDDYNVEYVVAQTDFWVDLDQMKKLQRVLQSDKFTRVHRIEPYANYPNTNADRELVIYLNRDYVPGKGDSRRMRIDMPIIGTEFEGRGRRKD